MSDTHIVLVTIDHAPWDSDVVAEPHLFSFSGPDEAQKFKLEAVRLAESLEEAQMSVYDPEPAVHFGNAEAAMTWLGEWLEEIEEGNPPGMVDEGFADDERGPND